MGIKIGKLVRSPWNVRKSYHAETITDLAENISKEGMISRIVVRKLGSDGKYEVLAGGRRVEALRSLYGEDHEIGSEHLIVKDTMSDFDALSISISENVHRISFSTMELAEAAEAAKRLKPGIPTKEIGKMLWISDARTKRLLGVANDLENIPDRAKDEMSLPDEEEPLFTDSHWEAVSKHGSGLDRDQVQDVCDFIIDKEIPASQVDKVVKKFEEADNLIDGKVDENEPSPEDPFEEKFKGELKLVDEGGKQVVYVCGKDEDVPLDVDHFLEYLKHPEKFKVYLTAKIKIKPLEP